MSCFFLGGSYQGGWEGKGGFDSSVVTKTASATIDELKISDITIPEIVRLRGLESPVEQDFVIEVQVAARRHLDFIASLRKEEHGARRFSPTPTWYRERRITARSSDHPSW